jgi:hypothetical protein
MLLSLLLSLSALVPLSVAHAADLKPEERLQAIRQAMVDAAMSSHTRVSATSWMDSQGAVRDVNRFSSEIKLRDLQVAEYSRDSNNEPRAKLVAKQLDMVEPQRCQSPQAKAPLRHVMSLGLDISPQFIPAQRYEAQQVGRTARARLVDMANDAQHWRLMTDVVHTRSYDRAMHGHGEEKVQWHLQISVVPANYYTTEGKSGYVMRWQAQAQGRNDPIQGEYVLGITPPTVAIGAPKMNADLTRSIDMHVQRLVQQLDHKLSCDPASFAVNPSTDGKFVLTAGAKAGLRVGDKVLLSDPRVLPQHALEVGALDGAVLAEVKSVSAYQSELKQVAGKAQKNQGSWVAWPYTY